MKKQVIAGVVWLVWMACAQAGISLNQTRVVFMADSPSTQVTVRNSGDEVYLIQAVILNDKADAVSRDFMVTPPLFRLEGDADNVLRIMRAGGHFAQDRESLRFFMIRAIPSSQTPLQKKGSALSIALGTQIKLFYRPAKLHPQVTDSYGLLKARVQGNKLVVHNPTPYYQSFAQVKLDGKEVDFDHQPQMVAPFGEVSFSLSEPIHRWQWSCITDYGGESALFSQTVS